MGIHDFDLARWFMGEVASVQAVGGVLAYPELGAVGDIDNAIISLMFTSGRLGVVDLTRNGIYGYDIMTELLGTAGTLRIGYLRETPLMVMTKGSVAHDTVPYFMERFGDAYTTQLENFAQNVLQGRTAADHGGRWRRGAEDCNRRDEGAGDDGPVASTVVERRGGLDDALTDRCCARGRSRRTSRELQISLTPRQARWEYVGFAVRQIAGRRDLDRTHGRRRDLSGAAVGSRVGHLVTRAAQACAARPAAGRVHRLSARRLPAAWHDVRGESRAATPKSRSADRLRPRRSRRG